MVLRAPRAQTQPYRARRDHKEPKAQQEQPVQIQPWLAHRARKDQLVQAAILARKDPKVLRVLKAPKDHQMDHRELKVLKVIKVCRELKEIKEHRELRAPKDLKALKVQPVQIQL